ncbi:MAG: hypothetical protein COV45_00170 [Deltaproteobacteria bacterium CG11_big_fil_rev_8_21_14_0_20_47_16]|nr:MAG: hypothetical protein COV45_00170 [Deltaproteobacteria bacterium CG11_big_fil_rev_8_21_14_0_20_47_16]
MVWISKQVIIATLVVCASPIYAQAPSTPTAPAASKSAAPMSGLNLGEFDTSKPGQLKWENNPFVKTVESIGVQDMHLTAIVYRPGSAAALINDLVVKEGDHVGDSQVVHIEAKRVVMRNDDGIFSLTLSGRAQ